MFLVLLTNSLSSIHLEWSKVELDISKWFISLAWPKEEVDIENPSLILQKKKKKIRDFNKKNVILLKTYQYHNENVTKLLMKVAFEIRV